MAADKSIGRSEAMRRSMLALIEVGAPREAHPAFWAPFVVVGEGTAKIEARPALVTDNLPNGIFPVVSSTHARDVAEQIAAEVRAKGATYLGAKRVNVPETDIPGKGIFYRVLIEPSSGRSEATKICNRLKSLGFVDCFLVAQP